MGWCPTFLDKRCPCGNKDGFDQVPQNDRAMWIHGIVAYSCTACLNDLFFIHGDAAWEIRKKQNWNGDDDRAELARIAEAIRSAGKQWRGAQAFKNAPGVGTAGRLLLCVRRTDLPDPLPVEWLEKVGKLYVRTFDSLKATATPDRPLEIPLPPKRRNRPKSKAP